LGATDPKLLDRSARLRREEAFWNQVYVTDGQPGDACAWMKYVEEATYTARFFNALAHAATGRKVLSIGGGLDRLAVSLAGQGRQIVCVDIAAGASAMTRALAEQHGVSANVEVVTAGCEELAFPSEEFDLVLSKRALHHMEVEHVLTKLHASLRPGGVFLAEEPVCLSRLMSWAHKKFPFYGNATHTIDEKELGPEQLAIIERQFSRVDFHFFDFLARESLAYLLTKARCGRLLGILGRLDGVFVNRLCRPLRRLCNYVVVHAVK
jgi:ubiquinone/menaquinone biosynthesis C-methylase UbiE